MLAAAEVDGIEFWLLTEEADTELMLLLMLLLF